MLAGRAPEDALLELGSVPQYTGRTERVDLFSRSISASELASWMGSRTSRRLMLAMLKIGNLESKQIEIVHLCSPHSKAIE